VQFTQGRARESRASPDRTQQEADMNMPNTSIAQAMFTTLVVSLAIQAGYYFCCLKSLAL